MLLLTFPSLPQRRGQGAGGSCREGAQPAGRHGPPPPQVRTRPYAGLPSFLSPHASHLHRATHAVQSPGHKSWREAGRAVAPCRWAPGACWSYPGSQSRVSNFTSSHLALNIGQSGWGHAKKSGEASLWRGCGWTVLGGGGLRREHAQGCVTSGDIPNLSVP